MATSEFINKLVEIVGEVDFKGKTIAEQNLIQKYQRSVNKKPQTSIGIFSTRLRTQYLESKMNKRFYTLTIRIRCLAESREEQAQQDMDILEENIIEKLENSLNRMVVVNDSYLDNDEIESQIRNFQDNYYTKDIPLRIARRVIVNV